ncbi:uncharacterized protein LOC108595006 [Drosophila busckii]|uniref:uncharacterized protein LOC108595006 n=1 Tax=Drosophila busckii TaxID=30019 RepID=UPI00083EFBBA|nr:uncharacterized protein LOC108595006 [Drosophila busckii]
MSSRAQEAESAFAVGVIVQQLDELQQGEQQQLEQQEQQTLPPDSQTGDNEAPLDFLQFLKTLEDAPLPRAAPQTIETQTVHVSGEGLELELRLNTESTLGQLNKHQFTHKLFVATSSELVGFVNWAAQGQLLQVDYLELQEHLSAGQQRIFEQQSVLEFNQQLLRLGFQRVPQSAAQAEQEQRPQLYYQHKQFKQCKPQQLLSMSTPRTKRSLAAAVESPLELARSRFLTLLNYHNDVRLLQEREPSAEQFLPRRGRIGSQRQSTVPLTPALAAKHVNPKDSVLHFESGHVPEYAGFYGQVEPTLINEFFAEYLPRYGSHTLGYKEVVVDASKANGFQQNLPIGIVYSEDEDDELLHPDNPDYIAPPPAAVTAQSEPQLEHTPNDDFELEQVMQELCGVTNETDELKLPSPSKTKGKRKKSLRKILAESDSDELPEQPVEAEAKEAAEPEPSVKAEAIAEALATEETATKPAKDEEHQATVKAPAVKRRRYDLRNSKSRRTR